MATLILPPPWRIVALDPSMCRRRASVFAALLSHLKMAASCPGVPLWNGISADKWSGPCPKAEGSIGISDRNAAWACDWKMATA